MRLKTFEYNIIENKNNIKVIYGSGLKSIKSEHSLFPPTKDMDHIEEWESRLDNMNEPYALVEVTARFLEESYTLGYVIVLDKACSFVFQHEDYDQPAI